MPENTTTKTTSAPAKRPSTARKSGAAARRTPSASTGRRVRTVARNETREAAAANVRAAQTTAKQGRNVAERAALVYVGATLEARDRAVALVTDLRDVATSRESAERRIGKYERRGSTARNRFERDVRKARTRLERELRGRRRAAERIAAAAKERVSAIA